MLRPLHLQVKPALKILNAHSSRPLCPVCGPEACASLPPSYFPSPAFLRLPLFFLPTRTRAFTSPPSHTFPFHPSQTTPQKLACRFFKVTATRDTQGQSQRLPLSPSLALPLSFFSPNPPQSIRCFPRGPLCLRARRQPRRPPHTHSRNPTLRTAGRAQAAARWIARWRRPRRRRRAPARPLPSAPTLPWSRRIPRSATLEVQRGPR